MDIQLVFINFLLLYGIFVSIFSTYAKESMMVTTSSPWNKKIGSNLPNPVQHFSNIMPLKRMFKLVWSSFPFHYFSEVKKAWNQTMFKPASPKFKHARTHFIKQHAVHPKAGRNMKHVGLLQDSPKHQASFVCPEGYRKRVAGGNIFCTPTKTEQELAKEKPQCTDNLQGCEHANQIPEPNTCPDGSEPVVSQGKTQCVDKAALNSMICLEGTRLANSEAGLTCEPIPLTEEIELDFPNSQPPSKRHPSMALKSGQKATKEDDVPTCNEGKVVAMSQNGYICVDPVFPPSVCPENLVPSMSTGGIQCVPCPYGQKVVRTEQGVKCETGIPTAIEKPCPAGLQAVHTAVGRICQYVPFSGERNVPQCPGAQRLELKGGLMTCVSEFVCPPGQIMVQFENNEKRCETPSMTDQSDCLEGEILYEGACISIRLAEKFFGAPKGPCKHGEFLVVSNSGSVCQPVLETGMKGYQKSVSTSCGPGTIVTQTSDGFRCLQGELPLYMIPMCEKGFVIAKLEEAYECISINDADLICTGTTMVRVDGGFVCNSVVHEVQCASDEFNHTDQDGRTTCLSHQEASELCGNDYVVLRNGNSFICRKRIENVNCPDGFFFSFEHGKPLCIQEGEDCQEIAGAEISGCLDKVPYCQQGYKMISHQSDPYCELDLAIGFEEPGLAETEIQPCEADGMVRPCDLPADLLLSDCNPGCANGGSCVNGSCICPPGISGHACHIDVNECESHPCVYNCENTFGSYQCRCPRGMYLSTDGRSCTDAVCIPECLNNGDCIRGQCRCTSGFEGQYCQNDKDECMKYGDRLCQHQCRNTYGSYTCICPPGSRLNPDGRTCLNTTCIPECRNGGTCRNHRCHCPSGFYGIICQFDVNECRKSKPCNHKCVNSWGSFSCTCNEGFVLHTDGRACVRE